MKVTTTACRCIPLVAAAVLLCGIPASSTGQTENDDLAGIQLEAYLSLIAADEARESNDLAGAFDKYRDAVLKYRELAVNHPEWQPDIVRYRIRHGLNQLRELQLLLKSSTAADSSAAEPDPVRPATRPSADSEQGGLADEQCAALRLENAYLRRRVEELEQEMDAAGPGGGGVEGESTLRGFLAEAEAEVDRLADEAVSLREERDTLKEDLAGARSASEEAATERDAAVAERDCVIAERDEAEAAKAQMDAALDSALAEAQGFLRQITDLKEQLEQQRRREEELTSRTGTLQEELEQLRDAIPASEKERDQLRISVEQLTAETDTLRGTVARLQEELLHFETAPRPEPAPIDDPADGPQAATNDVPAAAVEAAPEPLTTNGVSTADTEVVVVPPPNGVAAGDTNPVVTLVITERLSDPSNSTTTVDGPDVEPNIHAAPRNLPDDASLLGAVPR